MTETHIAELVAAHSCVREVWLFGSRANDTHRPDSDWDYLLFTDDARLLNALCHDPHFRKRDVDLLIVDGPFAISPWPEPDGSWKKLRLYEDLDWKQTSETRATYLQTKKRNPDNARDIAVDLRRIEARRVYWRPG